MRLPSFLTQRLPALYNPADPQQQYTQPDVEQQHYHHHQHQQQQEKQGGTVSNQQTAGGPVSNTSETLLSNFSVQHPPPPPDLVKFQALVGIYSPSYFQGLPPPPILRRSANSSTLLVNLTNPLRPASNKGIYKRTVDEENRARLYYAVSSAVISTFYLLQIVVGAALTALGAANGPSSAVTILGAINTIIAGLLT